MVSRCGKFLSSSCFKESQVWPRVTLLTVPSLCAKLPGRSLSVKASGLLVTGVPPSDFEVAKHGNAASLVQSALDEASQTKLAALKKDWMQLRSLLPRFRRKLN